MTMHRPARAPRRAAAAAAAFASLALAAACASAPSGPPPFEPAGSYDFTAYSEGEAISGTMTIAVAGEGYEGTISTDLFPPIPITAVTVDGQTGTIVANGPLGPLTIFFGVTGAELTGTWVMGDQNGDFSGTKTG